MLYEWLNTNRDGWDSSIYIIPFCIVACYLRLCNYLIYFPGYEMLGRQSFLSKTIFNKVLQQQKMAIICEAGPKATAVMI